MVRITVLHHPKSWSGPLRRQTLACAGAKRSKACGPRLDGAIGVLKQKVIKENPAQQQSNQ
jgi:hypothetical protein